MSKDLSKEYNEAVRSSLPDLWSRIEAAIDAEEQSEPIPFKAEEKSGEPVKNNAGLKAVPPVQKKKKKIIPTWLLISLPSVAVVLIVLTPLIFFGGLVLVNGGSKSSAPMAYDACDAEPAASVSKENAITGTVNEDAEYANAIELFEGDYLYDIELDDGKASLSANVKQNASETPDMQPVLKRTFAEVEIQNIYEDEYGMLTVTARVLSVKEDEKAEEDEILELNGEDVIEAYLYQEFDCEEGKTYDVIVYLVSETDKDTYYISSQDGD